MSLDTILAIVAMTGTFAVSLATFVWWIATKFLGLEKSILGTIQNLHSQNIERFHGIETRLTIVEKHRGTRL